MLWDLLRLVLLGAIIACSRKSVDSLSLASISESLDISYNYTLLNIDGLWSLSFLGDDIRIGYHPSLCQNLVVQFISCFQSLGWMGETYIDGNGCYNLGC
jgi:hypothetical protein